MAAPRDIIDALESVVSIFFSDVRHRLRASFILTDEMVEVVCKARALASGAKLGFITFPDLLKHHAVLLDTTSVPLGITLAQNHATRNTLQHSSAAATVDEQHCADAILDGVGCIEHCFPGTTAAIPEPLKVSLRVIRLHSTTGNPPLRVRFEDEMRRHRWNGANRSSRVSEPPILVGSKRFWGIVMLSEYAQVEGILNRVGVP